MKLQRSLGVVSITAIGVGAIIGAGIFVLTVLEYAMGAATVAVGWSGYAVSILHNFGVTIPPELTAAPGVSLPLPGGGTAAGLFNLPAVLIVAALTLTLTLTLVLVLVLGTKETARLNNVMVAVKLVVVVAFIGVGAFYVQPAHWRPFLPDNTGEFGHFGWSGVLRGSAVVFFAYIGFDSVSTAAQEARNPQRDMPIGILGSLAICTVLYIAVAAVLTGIVPYDQLDVPDPIARAIDVIGLGWFAVLVKLGALTGLTTVILVLLYGQSRIFFSMAEDGLLPRLFAHVHPRFGTPYRSQMLIGGLVALVAALVPLEILGEMVSIGTLSAFILVCGAVITLRRSERSVPRPLERDEAGTAESDKP